MMFIRVASDLHLEHTTDMLLSDGIVAQHMARDYINDILPPLSTDSDSVLILAGDIGTARRADRIKRFLQFVMPRFLHTIYVLGNHEHYGFEFDSTFGAIQNELEADSAVDMAKLTLVGNKPEIHGVGNVIFICGTLWTDYANGDAEVAAAVQSFITDHRVIMDSGKPITTSRLAEVHHASLRRIIPWLQHPDNSRVVMVTHHMPSFTAVDPKYMLGKTERLLNHAFTSNLDEFIKEHKPGYWVFGHTHTRYMGMLGDTRLICNPLGYPTEHNLETGRYNPAEVIQLS